MAIGVLLVLGRLGTAIAWFGVRTLCIQIVYDPRNTKLVTGRPFGRDAVGVLAAFRGVGGG